MYFEIEGYLFKIYKCYDSMNNEVLCYSMDTPKRDYPFLEYSSSAVYRMDNDRIFNGVLRFLSHVDIPREIKAQVVYMLFDINLMKKLG